MNLGFVLFDEPGLCSLRWTWALLCCLRWTWALFSAGHFLGAGLLASHTAVEVRREDMKQICPDHLVLFGELLLEGCLETEQYCHRQSLKLGTPYRYISHHSKQSFDFNVMLTVGWMNTVMSPYSFNVYTQCLNTLVSNTTWLKTRSRSSVPARIWLQLGKYHNMWEMLHPKIMQ